MSQELELIRGHVAYLRLYLKWRDSHADALAAFEPEPRKITAALEAVTAHLLKRLVERRGEARREGRRPRLETSPPLPRPTCSALGRGTTHTKNERTKTKTDHQAMR